MLRQETVVQKMFDTIKNIQSNPLFKDFYLAGGTALALQLGHRTSTDIDLFTYTHNNFYDISMHLHKNPKNYKIDIDQEGFIRTYTNGIKVEFVYDDVGKLIKEPVNVNGIICLDKSEIAPMKLNSVTGRNKARDFIDIAYLLQEISLENMFDLYKKKYGNVNLNIVKRDLLNKCQSIKEDKSLKDIKILRNDIKLEDIPEIIKNAIDTYNNTVGIGKRNGSNRNTKIPEGTIKALPVNQKITNEIASELSEQKATMPEINAFWKNFFSDFRKWIKGRFISVRNSLKQGGKKKNEGIIENGTVRKQNTGRK